MFYIAIRSTIYSIDICLQFLNSGLTEVVNSFNIHSFPLQYLHTDGANSIQLANQSDLSLGTLNLSMENNGGGGSDSITSGTTAPTSDAATISNTQPSTPSASSFPEHLAPWFNEVPLEDRPDQLRGWADQTRSVIHQVRDDLRLCTDNQETGLSVYNRIQGDSTYSTAVQQQAVALQSGLSNTTRDSVSASEELNNLMGKPLANSFYALGDRAEQAANIGDRVATICNASIEQLKDLKGLEIPKPK